MKRLIPTYKPRTVEIYLEDGIDPNDFRYVLTERYGRSISDTAKEAAAMKTASVPKPSSRSRK